MNEERTISEVRSRNMAAIRGKDTAPELAIRRILHAMGLRFRLHRKDLPGRPDIVLPKHRTVVFVHGCFWHRHENCRHTTTPKTRQEFWQTKFAANIERDRRNQTDLQQLGWRVIVIWECELRQHSDLETRLERLFRVIDQKR